VNPLIGATDLGIHRTICNYTETSGCVKPCQKIFLRDFLKVWKRDWLECLASSKAKGLWSLSLFLAQGISRPRRNHADRAGVGNGEAEPLMLMEQLQHIAGVGTGPSFGNGVAKSALDTLSTDCAE